MLKQIRAWWDSRLRVAKATWARVETAIRREAEKPPTIVGRTELPALGARATDLFVNRDTPIAVFTKAVLGIDADRSSQVLTFYGVGGQGKTHLCKRFGRMLDAEPSEIGPNLRWGMVDLHRQTERKPEYASLWVRNALKQSSKVAFPSFDFAFELYWKEMRANGPMPRIDNHWWEEVQGGVGTVTSAGAQAMLEGVPFVGSILGRLGRHGAARVRHEVLRRSNDTLAGLFSRDGRLLPPLEIQRQLPRILALDLADWRIEHPNDRFVVLIDEYESALEANGAGGIFQEAGFDQAVQKLVSECRSALFVFFSREKLVWEMMDPKWTTPLADSQHLLHGLDSKDAARFLTLAGVADPLIRQSMIKGASAPDALSGTVTCFPIMLDMQVEIYNSLLESDAPVSPSDFEIEGASFATRRLKLLTRLLGRYPLQLRTTLQRLAVASRFDERVFRFVIGHFMTGQPAGSWNVVKSLSFVQRTETENVFVFHNVMREGLLASLDPADRDDSRRALFGYYESRMAPGDAGALGVEQARAASDAFHQIASYDAKGACTWWLNVGQKFRDERTSPGIEGIDRASVKLAAETFGGSSVEHAEHLWKLAVNLSRQARFEDEEHVWRAALVALQAAGAMQTLLAAQVLGGLGICLDFQKRHDEAAPILTDALAIRQLAEAPTSEIAIAMAALGANLKHRGKYDDAEGMVREALKIEGDQTVFAAAIMQNLGLCISDAEVLRIEAKESYRKERLDEAEALHRKALEIRKRAFGEEHFRTAESLTYLAFIMDVTERFEEAEPLLKRTIEIVQGIYGLEHRETAGRVRAYGRMLYHSQRYAESEQKHREALAIRERVLGPSHPETADSCFHLGRCLHRQGRLQEAITYLRRGYEIRESVLGADHRDTKLSAKMFGQALIDLSEREKSVSAVA